MVMMEDLYKENTIYKCDKCNRTFKAKEIKLKDAATNVNILTPICPLIFISKEGKIMAGGSHAEEGDKVLVCPYCDEVHLYGFDAVK